MEFILANLPIILCFVAGLALIILEAFMPGFGVAGVCGIGLQIATIVLIYLNYGGMAALGSTVVILAILGVAVTLCLRSATKGRLSRSKIILHDTESAESGYSANEEMSVFLGKEGITTTVLRPAGMAEFDGVKLNVVSDGEFIQKDVRVRIVKTEGARVLVKAV